MRHHTAKSFNTAKLRILSETTKFLRENFYKNHLSAIGVGTTIQNWIVANLAPAAVYLTNSKLNALARHGCVPVCAYMRRRIHAHAHARAKKARFFLPALGLVEAQFLAFEKFTKKKKQKERT